MGYSSYAGAIDAAASQYGVPSNLLAAQIGVESGYNPSAFNVSSGATGIAQILPSTAANPGYGLASVNPNDPNASIGFAAAYDSVMYALTGSWTGALQRYGSLPSDGSAGTTAQQQLAAIAAGADGNGISAADIASAAGVGTSEIGQLAPGTAGVTSTSNCGYNPGCYLTALGGWIGQYLTGGAFIVVGLILLLGAIYLFGKQS